MTVTARLAKTPFTAVSLARRSNAGSPSRVQPQRASFLLSLAPASAERRFFSVPGRRRRRLRQLANEQADKLSTPASAGRPDEKRALRASHALYGCCCCCCTLLGLGSWNANAVTQPLPQRTNNVFFQSGLPGCQMPTSTIDSLSIHVR